ncbi:flagellar hook-basal body complex protein [Methylopila sp. 73B]|uniref:flagellar hook protein FlgE n=1 Tax=Methylopila sp. 73B TaxID=1120792 RepID=UPI00037D678A|nr:flagellar hook-basal body complex protein [Methylopila sp. 73B]
MGIYGALTTAVSGLSAQSYALENISGNIANSSTTAYKRTDTAFQDLVTDSSGAKTQTSGSVAAYSQATNNVQGTVTASESDTSIAISGDGYFLVQDSSGATNGETNFTGTDLYTRRGDFELDKNDNLVNGAGYYLVGNRVSDSGTASSTAEVIDISDDEIYPAKATSTVNYEASLPTVPQTENYDSTDSSSYLLESTVGSTISADDADSFLESSVSGGSVTVYDANGTAQDLTLRWAKTSNADSTAGTDDTWSLYYLSDSTATGTETAWTQIDADSGTAGTQGYVFENGKLTTPSSGATTVTDLTIDGTSYGDVTLKHGSGLTQYANSEGTVSTSKLTQDGVASGEMTGLAIEDGGALVATYSNGKTKTLYEIPVATFAADNQLKQLDGGAFAMTEASGTPTLVSGSSIVGSAIEESNVDIADEFTKLIVTQQAYSANTRVVTTANSMMDDVLQMLR